MGKKLLKWRRFFSFFLIIIGCGMVILAAGADFFRFGGGSGIGVRQLILAMVGLLLLGSGIFLVLPVGQKLIIELTSSSPGSQQPVSVLNVALWFGLVTGLCEVLILVYQKVIQNQVINMSHHFGWMVPMGDALVFLLPGLFFFLLSRIQPKLASLRITVILFAILGLLSLLLMFPRIHLYATLLLSIGFGLQASRFAAIRTSIFYWLVRRTTPVLIMIVFGIAALTYGFDWVSERSKLAQLPPASPQAPNVLFIVLDTVRAENMSLYGYSRPTTPNLERLAQKGVIFQQVFSTAPWTLPSHASMFTGHWYYEQPISLYSAFGTVYPTISEAFSAEGYRTAGFVANTYYCSYEHGLNRGFIHYEDYTVSLEQIIFSSSLVRSVEIRLRKYFGQNRLPIPKTAAQVNHDFLRWLSHNKGYPFFAFLNYMDAHFPYQPPKPYNEMFGTQKRRANLLAKPREMWSPEEIQAEIDAYDGGIAYLDVQIGLLYQELEKTGLLDNTVILITSDHGEHLGEHRIFDHANSLYKQLIQVPMLWIFPSKVPEGEVVSAPVSLRNIPVTLFDLTQIRTGAQFPGKSLARYWQDANGSADSGSELILSELNATKEDYPAWYPIIKGDMKSLVANQFHYILNGDGSEELYDLTRDPNELDNLVNYSRSLNKLLRFRTSMSSLFPNKVTFSKPAPLAAP